MPKAKAAPAAEPVKKEGPSVELVRFVLVRDPANPKRIAVVKVAATVEVATGEVVADFGDLPSARMRLASRYERHEASTASSRLEPISWK